MCIFGTSYLIFPTKNSEWPSLIFSVLLQEGEIHIRSVQKRRFIKPRCNHLALGHSKGFSCHLQVFEVNQVSIHIRVFLYQFRNLASAHKKIRRDLKNWKKKWLHSLNVQYALLSYYGWFLWMHIARLSQECPRDEDVSWSSQQEA